MKTKFAQLFANASFVGITQIQSGLVDYWIADDGLHIFALSDTPGDYIATNTPDLYLI
jgi:hypothetical protein